MSSTATRRGSHPRPKGRSQQPQDDTEEVRNLRSKYSDKLEMIRELFPTWTDEDLLFALQDALGDVELVVVRISDGLVEQFSSVKPKKQNKKETTTTSASSANRSAPVSTDAPAPTRSSERGGRGRGGASVRGARGGRGGSRGVGGRGGGIAPQANGHNARSPEESTTTPQSFASIATPTSGTSWAAALGRSSKVNGAPSAAPSAASVFADTSATAPASDFAGGWDVDASGTNPAATGWDAVDEPAAAPAVQATESATTTAALPSAVQESQPAVKVPGPAKSVPKSSAMSWAQIARKSEAPKPVPVIPTQPTEALPQATPLAPSTSDAPADMPAPVSNFTAGVSAPAEMAGAAPEQAAELESITAQPVAEPTIAEQASGPTEVDLAAAAAAPPGLPKAVTRNASQRTSQRARQDAPVVMAGGASQIDKLGVQFGSLNFLGGDDDESAEQTGESQTEQQPAATDAAAPSIARTQPALHDRLGQSQASQDSYGQQQGQYNGYKSDAFDSSYGFTGQSQQQQPAASNQQGPQDQVQGYNGFSSAGHGASQTQPQPQQGLQDYSSMYGGLDTQRLAQFYGQYDQGSNAFGQRADDKSQQQQSSQQQSGDQHTPQPQHLQGHQAGPGLHQQQAPQQQQQQQFPGIMPYYYPHYYMPNQFQHYGQPGGGYGQYPVYGQPAAQPQQHHSKPGTPANVASPYNQGGPQGDANSYGAQSQYGHQTPSAANLSSYDQGFARNNTQGAPGLGGMSDYSKIYGGAIPGLGGFLGSSGGGAPPSQTGGSGNSGSGASGTPHMSSQQKAGGASSGSALDSYRQFDANAGKPSGPPGAANQTGRGQGQTQSGPQPHQGQPHQGQQQQQQQQAQQQQYYQQYGVYGHQGNSSAYSNYPYARQYWGQ